MSKYYGSIPNNDYISVEFLKFVKHGINLRKTSADQAVLRLFNDKWDALSKPSLYVNVASWERDFEQAKQSFLKEEWRYTKNEDSFEINGKKFDIAGCTFNKISEFNQNASSMKWFLERQLRELNETETKINQIRVNAQELINFFGFNQDLDVILQLWDDKPKKKTSLIEGDIISYWDGNPYKIRWASAERASGYIKHKTQNKYTEKTNVLELTKDNWKVLEKSDNWKYYNILFAE